MRQVLLYCGIFSAVSAHPQILPSTNNFISDSPVTTIPSAKSTFNTAAFSADFTITSPIAESTLNIIPASEVPTIASFTTVYASYLESSSLPNSEGPATSGNFQSFQSEIPAETDIATQGFEYESSYARAAPTTTIYASYLEPSSFPSSSEGSSDGTGVATSGDFQSFEQPATTIEAAGSAATSGDFQGPVETATASSAFQTFDGFDEYVRARATIGFTGVPAALAVADVGAGVQERRRGELTISPVLNNDNSTSSAPKLDIDAENRGGRLAVTLTIVVLLVFTFGFLVAFEYGKRVGVRSLKKVGDGEEGGERGCGVGFRGEGQSIKRSEGELVKKWDHKETEMSESETWSIESSVAMASEVRMKKKSVYEMA